MTTLPCEGKTAIWFSENAGDIAYAIGHCRTCPIIDECHRMGQQESWGVWGGENKRETPVDRVERFRVRRKEGLAMLARGASTRSVAAKFGVSPSAVRLWRADARSAGANNLAGSREE